MSDELGFAIVAKSQFGVAKDRHQIGGGYFGRIFAYLATVERVRCGETVGPNPMDSDAPSRHSNDDRVLDDGFGRIA